MRIAIPVSRGRLCAHFGHCERFALVDVDQTSQQTTTTWLTPPPHEPGVLPQWLHAQGATVVIAGGMGQRARQLFQASGIEVIVGAKPEAPEDLVQAYLNGSLASGPNLCDH